MSSLGLCEHCSNSAQLILRHSVIQISPECFNRNLNLCNCQHTILNSSSLMWLELRVEVLNITSKVKFRMHPVTVADCVPKLHKLRILVWLHCYTLLKYISLSILSLFFSI